MTSTEDTSRLVLKKTIEAAMNTALVVIHFNGVTEMAERAFRNIISAADIKGLNIIWRLDYITVSYIYNGQSELITKPVLSVGTSLNGLYNVMELSENVKAGKISVENLNSELKKIIALPLIHKRWVYILLDGLAAAFYLKFHHGSWESIAVVLFAAMVGESVRYFLQEKDIPGNRIMFVCGLISAGIASVFLRIGIGDAGITTLLASVIYLVPGLRMINGFIDMTDLNYIYIGTQRILNAVYLLLILAVVILIADTILKLNI